MNSSIISTKPVNDKLNFKSINSEKTSISRYTKKTNLEQSTKSLNFKLTPRIDKKDNSIANVNQDLKNILKTGELVIYGKCLMSKYLNNHIHNTKN